MMNSPFDTNNIPKEKPVSAEEAAFRECEMLARDGDFGKYSKKFLIELMWRDPAKLSAKGYRVYRWAFEMFLDLGIPEAGLEKND